MATDLARQQHRFALGLRWFWLVISGAAFALAIVVCLWPLVLLAIPAVVAQVWAMLSFRRATSGRRP